MMNEQQQQLEDQQTLRSLALTVGLMLLGTLCLAVTVNIFY